MHLVEYLKEKISLKRLQQLQAIAGVLAMIAIVGAVGNGVAAFMTEEDSWLAMRLPLGAAMILLCFYARCAKTLLDAPGRVRPR